MSDIGALAGRILLAAIFILGGFGKLTAVAGVTGALERRGFPAPMAFGYAAGALELAGGLLVLAGIRTRYVALVMACFTAGTIWVAHHFWDMEGAARAMNQIQAMKNLAIIGGFLLLASFGPGRLSLDGRSA
jgi:putative oxidoreductase